MPSSLLLPSLASSLPPPPVTVSFPKCVFQHAGGECLAKGAKAIEELEPDTSAAMFKEAIIMFEADGREAQARRHPAAKDASFMMHRVA